MVWKQNSIIMKSKHFYLEIVTKIMESDPTYHIHYHKQYGHLENKKFDKSGVGLIVAIHKEV